MSGSDGGNDTAGVDTDRFVLGGSVRWGEVAEAIFGIGLRIASLVVVGAVLFVGNAIVGLFDWVSTGYASLVSLPLVQGSGIIALSSIETARWIALLGVFAWPVAVAVIGVLVLIVVWGVSRLG